MVLHYCSESLSDMSLMYISAHLKCEFQLDTLTESSAKTKWFTLTTKVLEARSKINIGLMSTVRTVYSVLIS